MLLWNVGSETQSHDIRHVCRFQADDLHRGLSGGGAGCDGSDLLPAGQVIT